MSATALVMGPESTAFTIKAVRISYCTRNSCGIHNVIRRPENHETLNNPNGIGYPLIRLTVLGTLT
jgi:hypothetical protein